MSILLVVALMGGWQFEPEDACIPPAIETTRDVSSETEDNRPFATLFVLDAGCVYCRDAERDSLRADFPARIVRVVGNSPCGTYPVLQWEDKNGNWRRIRGWNDERRRQFVYWFPRTVNTQAKAFRSTGTPAGILGTAIKFAGPSGTLHLVPDSPVSVDVNGTSVMYRSVGGRYTLSGDEPGILLDSPTPAFTTPMGPFHVGGYVDPKVTYDPRAKQIGITGRSGIFKRKVTVDVGAWE